MPSLVGGLDAPDVAVPLGVLNSLLGSLAMALLTWTADAMVGLRMLDADICEDVTGDC